MGKLFQIILHFLVKTKRLSDKSFLSYEFFKVFLYSGKMSLKTKWIRTVWQKACKVGCRKMRKNLIVEKWRVGYGGSIPKEHLDCGFWLVSWCLGRRALPWILENPMRGQNFKWLRFQFWHHFWIPLKKLVIESVFLFSNFLQEHDQNGKNLFDMRLFIVKGET